MNFLIEYSGRDLFSCVDGVKIAGLAEVLSYISENKEKLKLVTISGQTESYSFKRQIYLMANLLGSFGGFEVVIDNKKISPDKFLTPTYKQ